MTKATNSHSRYILLDELRGIAAVAVLIFHVGTRTDGPVIFPNGYLAVDFFFMLSGFVIAEAYGSRLNGGMTFGDFARRRLIRMMPIVALGVAIGFTYFLARWLVMPQRSDSIGDLLAAGAMNLLMIPKWWYGAVSRWELFPVNGPLWSLFFELLINLAWAALFARGRMLAQLVIVIASGTALALLAAHHGTMEMGWELTSVDGGLARVTFGFTAGLLLHNLRRRWKSLGKWAGWLAIAVLLFIFALPVEHPAWTAFAAIVLLPCAMILAIAAGRHRIVRGGTFLGAISYPLYGIHSPLLGAFSGALEKSTGLETAGWWNLLVVPPIILLSWLALTCFETPARKWLQAAFRKEVATAQRS